jgi:hypothetical protein
MSLLRSTAQASTLQGAATGAAWQAVLARPLFAKPVGSGSETLMHAGRLFAARSAELWREPDVLAWLLRCAEAAVAAAEEDPAGPPLHESVPPVSDLQALVELSYPPGAPNEFAHVSLASIVDSPALPLPPEQLHDAADDAQGLRAAAEAIVRNLTAARPPVRIYSDLSRHCSVLDAAMPAQRMHMPLW